MTRLSPVAATPSNHLRRTLIAALVCLIPALATAATEGLWPVTATMPQGVMVHPADGRTGLLFGTSVGIDGDIAAVGAAFDTNGANASQGAIFVYERNGSAWPQKVRLLTTPGAAGDQTGAYVEVYGQEIFAGSPNAKDPASMITTGAVFVFKRGSDGNWTQTQMLVPNPPIQSGFGQRIAVDGNTLLIKGLDAALHQVVYVFTRQGATWTQTGSLVPTQGGSFSTHISLSGDVAVVGANAATNASSAVTGGAYVFLRSGSTWTQIARLLAADGASGDSYGFSVSVSGDDIAVGASGDDVGGNNNQGSVHLYHRSGTTVSEVAGSPIYAPDGVSGDSFGKDLRLCGSRLYVGASSHPNGVNSQQGQAYRWDKINGTWTYSDAFTMDAPGRSNAYFADHFGVSGNNLIVGVPFADEAYIYADTCKGDSLYRNGFD